MIFDYSLRGTSAFDMVDEVIKDIDLHVGVRAATTAANAICSK
jgi:hypothetical protein